MDYISTRGGAPRASFKDVLLQGLAPDGGLYVPSTYHPITTEDMSHFARLPYADVATRVLHPYMRDIFSENDLHALVSKAYASFTHGAVTPITQLDCNHWLLELFHGPTLAFKDVALQLLGVLVDAVLQKEGQTITVLGATSGDTGPAALAGFKDCAYADSFILYPHQRPSYIQRRQMTCLNQTNVHALAIEGTFDDCQNIVKQLFLEHDFRQQARLTAVNSVNWVRVIAQSVYYVLTTAILGNHTAFAVPSGNFGNMFAAYVAKRSGVPMGQLIIGTNSNDVLYRIFQQGEYRIRKVVASIAPAMDIQISSNFERLLFELQQRDATAVSTQMHLIKEQGSVGLSNALRQTLQQHFVAYRADDATIVHTIQQIYAQTGQMVDPHTAVGIYAAQQWRNAAHNHCEVPVVSLACAHVAKFSDTVEQALAQTVPLPATVRALLPQDEKIIVLPNSLDAVRDYLTQHARSCH